MRIHRPRLSSKPSTPAVASGDAFVDRHAQVYRDAMTDITFYTESDGDHLSAISANGRLLWTRNPHDWRKETITQLGPASPRETAVVRKRIKSSAPFIFVSFGREEGLVDQLTGNYYPLSRD